MKGHKMQHVRVSVGVLIWSPDGCLLLAQRLNVHGEGTWGPPGGHLEFGESFEACGRREIFEETGLTLQNLSLIGVTNDIFTQNNKHYVSLFLSTLLVEKTPPPHYEPEKTKPWEWVPIATLPDNLFLPMRSFFQQTPPITLFERAFQLSRSSDHPTHAGLPLIDLSPHAE